MAYGRMRSSNIIAVLSDRMEIAFVKMDTYSLWSKVMQHETKTHYIRIQIQPFDRSIRRMAILNIIFFAQSTAMSKVKQDCRRISPQLQAFFDSQQHPSVNHTEHEFNQPRREPCSCSFEKQLKETAKIAENCVLKCTAVIDSWHYLLLLNEGSFGACSHCSALLQMLALSSLDFRSSFSMRFARAWAHFERTRKIKCINFYIFCSSFLSTIYRIISGCQ